MTPAGQRWTREKPTVAGWYWYRRKDKTTYLLQVRQDMTVRGINLYADHVKSCVGEWQGPLTPNEATE